MKVMYIAGPGEPAETTAYGRHWRANVPVEISDKDGYDITESAKRELPDGSYQLVSKVRRVSIIEMARGNATFQVGDEEKKAPARKHIPRNASEYRAYALDWFKSETDPVLLRERWEQESDLRDRIGVGDEDISFLTPFFDIRTVELDPETASKRMKMRNAAA